MPTYEYECRNCGHRMEKFQNMKEPALSVCPSCNTSELKRLLGTGAGIIFKGAGFYCNDYGRKTAPPESAAAKPESAATATTAAATSEKQAKG